MLHAAEAGPQQKPKPKAVTPKPIGVYADCASVEATLDSLRVSPKGEFETTAEYEARAASIKISDKIQCFVFEKASLEYDADTQTYLVKNPSHKPKYADRLWTLLRGAVID